jgi:hypothetical protein
VTVDQVAAQKIGQDTAMPSLELGIEDPSLSCGDLSCAYRDTISWQSATSPLPMQNNPQVVFERLFGDGSTDSLRRVRREQSLSLRDSVMGDVNALNKKVSASDRARVDQYLNDLREIERRIEKAGQQVSSDLNVPAAPTGVPKDFEEHIKLSKTPGLLQQIAGSAAQLPRRIRRLDPSAVEPAIRPDEVELDAFRKSVYTRALQQTDGNFEEAAPLLDVNVKSLYRACRDLKKDVAKPSLMERTGAERERDILDSWIKCLWKPA